MRTPVSPTSYSLVRAELFSKHERKHLLIKGRELVGVFDTAEDAYSEGRRFGSAPFLIKHVLKEERVEHIPALSLGIIHANS